MAGAARGRATTAARPLWARLLDTVAEVAFGVGAALAAVAALAALVALAGWADTGAGLWLTTTASVLAGPVDALLTRLVSIDDPNHALAAVLAVSASVWLVLGWGLSRLVRPG